MEGLTTINWIDWIFWSIDPDQWVSTVWGKDCRQGNQFSSSHRWISTGPYVTHATHKALLESGQNLQTPCKLNSSRKTKVRKLLNSLLLSFLFHLPA